MRALRLLSASMTVVVLSLLASSVSAAPSTSTTNWLEYHGSPASTGVASTLRHVNTTAPKWVSSVLDGALDGLALATGHVVQSATLEAPANHFDTPSVGDHELLVDGAQRVFAFSATS